MNKNQREEIIRTYKIANLKEEALGFLQLISIIGLAASLLFIPILKSPWLALSLIGFCVLVSFIRKTLKPMEQFWIYFEAHSLDDRVSLIEELKKL